MTDYQAMSVALDNYNRVYRASLERYNTAQTSEQINAIADEVMAAWDAYATAERKLNLPVQPISNL